MMQYSGMYNAINSPVEATRYTDQCDIWWDVPRSTPNFTSISVHVWYNATVYVAECIT